MPCSYFSALPQAPSILELVDCINQNWFNKVWPVFYPKVIVLRLHFGAWGSKISRAGGA